MLTAAPSPDVVVVGAGPAGAATAILLAGDGYQVILLDRARFPRDKVCGEYLSPEASRMFDRLGVLKAVEARARPLCGMRITAPDGTVIVGDYPREGRWRGYRDYALTIPRRDLDAILVERARELGVTVREAVRVIDIVTAAQRVVGVEAVGLHAHAGPQRITASLVVGADGHAEGIATDRARGEIFLAPPAYAIVNPMADELANLSLVVPLSVARHHKGHLGAYFDRATRALPGLGVRLGAARRVSPVRALGPLAYRVAAPAHDGVVLVGDALGFLDPFTGEGVHTALRSAELAAEVAGPALRTGDLSRAALAPVHARRAAEFDGKRRVATLLQLIIGRPRLASHVVRRLRRRPAALDTLMGVVGDFAPPTEVLRPGFLARFLW